MEITSRDLIPVDQQIPQQELPAKSDTKPTMDSANLKKADLLAILTLLAEFRVPLVDMRGHFTVPGPYAKERPRAAYQFGTGLTCHIFQQKTSLRTEDLLPPGTLVAVKGYLADLSVCPSPLPGWNNITASTISTDGSSVYCVTLP
jgi:hypothetical protein